MNVRRSLVLCVVVILAVGPGRAEAGHQGNRYSVGIENSSPGYHGVEVARVDNTPGGVPVDGCAMPYTGHPVFQSQWVSIQPGVVWVEAGTGHQCGNAYVYRFWGYADATGWHSAGTSLLLSGGITRTHRLYKSSTNHNWYYYLDGAYVGTARSNWNVTAERVLAGYETYASTAISGKHSYGNLRYLKGSTWSPWSGRDAHRIDAAWGVCGTWSSTPSNHTYWYAAQNRPC